MDYTTLQKCRTTKKIKRLSKHRNLKNCSDSQLEKIEKILSEASIEFINDLYDDLKNTKKSEEKMIDKILSK